MKKLLPILVLSIVTVSLKADWMSDLLQNKDLQDLGRTIANEVQKYGPTIEKLGKQYGPMVANQARQIAENGSDLLRKLPADQRQNMITQAQKMIGQAAAVAQAQAQNNPQAVNAAQNLLNQHANELETIKSRALAAVRNNPDAANAIANYVNQARNASGL